MSKQTLTVTENDPTFSQIRKIWQRVVPAARKLGATRKMFQTALSYPGTEFEDGIVGLVVWLAKKPLGIVTPKRAEDTGLIPANWQVKTDKLEGDVGLTKLDYGCCPVRAGESWVNGDTMLQRAAEVGAIGSLGFAAELLKAQEEGKEIFPVESRGRHYFIMPLTVLLGGSDDRHVPASSGAAGAGCSTGDWLSGDFFRSDARFVRVRESAAA